MHASIRDIDWPPPPDWAEALCVLGAVRLRGVPMDADNRSLLRLAGELGPISMRALARHVRLAESGGVQRVQAMDVEVGDQYGKPLQSAGSARFPPHTDESFHRLPARWVMLHCWRPAAAGGQTLLVDAHAVLATVDRPTRVALEQYRLPYPCGEVTTVDAANRVRFNSAEVNALLDGRRPAQASRSRDWLQRFATGFASAEQRLTLSAADLLVIDNWRVLHGREAFPGTSARLLKRVRVLDLQATSSDLA